MADVTISVRPNGPLIVTGAVDVKDAEGNLLHLVERPKDFCGNSRG